MYMDNKFDNQAVIITPIFVYLLITVSFISKYDTDGRKRTIRKQDLEERTVILPPQINRDRLIDDLNYILKKKGDSYRITLLF